MNTTKLVSSSSDNNVVQDGLIIEVHSKDSYWLNKILDSNRFQSEMDKTKKILKRFLKPNGQIRVDLFIDPKKHFHQYKFDCKMHVLGAGKKNFTVENVSENYLKSITKNIQQSIKFLQHQESYAK